MTGNLPLHPVIRYHIINGQVNQTIIISIPILFPKWIEIKWSVTSDTPYFCESSPKIQISHTNTSTFNVSLFDSFSLAPAPGEPVNSLSTDTHALWRTTSCSSCPPWKRTWQTKWSKTWIKITLLGYRVGGNGGPSNNIYCTGLPLQWLGRRIHCWQ